MNAEIIIRDVLLEDSDFLSELAGQLGYPCESSEVKKRLTSYINNSNSRIIVAAIGERVVGWTSIDIVDHFYTPKYIGISGLVIDEKYRGFGIGKKMIEEVKDWSKKKYVSQIKLSANSIRKDAHRFYEHNGFTKMKEQYVFVCDVS